MCGKSLAIVSLLSACAALCCSEHQNDQIVTWKVLVDIVEKVAQPDKYEFIRSNYLTGYLIAHENHVDIKKLDADDKFALDVFSILTEDPSRNVEKDRRRLLRRDTICFPAPIGCIDSGDSGLRPR